MGWGSGTASGAEFRPALERRRLEVSMPGPQPEPSQLQTWGRAGLHLPASAFLPPLSGLGHCLSAPIRTTCLLFSAPGMDTQGVGTVSPFRLEGSPRQRLYLSYQIGLPGQKLSLPH